jgi:FdhE protein
MIEAQKAQELLVKKIDACKKRGFLPPELIDLVEKVYTRQLQSRNQAKVPAAANLEIADALQHGQGAPLMKGLASPSTRSRALNFSKNFWNL